MVFSQELGDEYVILRVLLDIQYFVKLTTILNTHTISFFLCVVDASSDGFLFINEYLQLHLILTYFIKKINPSYIINV